MRDGRGGRLVFAEWSDGNVKIMEKSLLWTVEGRRWDRTGQGVRWKAEYVCL